MSFKVDTIPTFDRQVKSIAKKYPSLKTDLSQFKRQLSEQPVQGAALGKDCFKVRMAISSKGKGKSGGARVITYVHVVGEIVYLLSIYDKSQKSSLNDGELDALLSELEID